MSVDYFPADSITDIEFTLINAGIRLSINRATTNRKIEAIRVRTAKTTRRDTFSEDFPIPGSENVTVEKQSFHLDISRRDFPDFFIANSVTHKPLEVLLKTNKPVFGSLIYGTDLPTDVAIRVPEFKSQITSYAYTSTDDTTVTNAQLPWKLAIGSCQYPGGLFDYDIAYQSWNDLAMRSSAADTPYTLILLGDQVYTDATAGIFDETDHSRKYLYPYDQFRSRTLAKGVPGSFVFALPDDHELVENWEPVAKGHPNESENAAARENGIKHFLLQAKGRPVLPTKNDGGSTADDDAEPSQLFRQIPYDVSLFMCDSRTERQHRHVQNHLEAKLISDTQQDELKGWLSSQPKDELKLIMSPSAVLPRLTRTVRHQVVDNGEVHGLPFSAAVLQSDSWQGFPATLFDILSFIATNNIRKVVFFSGDFHFSAVTTFSLKYNGKETIAASLHCSALYAPLPFANGLPNEFQLDDHFWFPNTELMPLEKCRTSFNLEHAIECRAYTVPVPVGDGFCFVNGADNQSAEIQCEFSNPREHRSHHCTVNLQTSAQPITIDTREWEVEE